MSRAGTTIAVAAFLAVGAAAVYWGPGLLGGNKAAPPSELCTVNQGQEKYTLTGEQANNAALIAAVGIAEGFEADGITVALATAIQESSLRNLDFGDRDSVGLFQQRPSQGWGTVEQIADPYYSTRTFYAALLKVRGWESMAVTDAAQAVQRSGFPLAYAYHEAEARAWAIAFTGGDALVTCSVSAPASSAPQQFAARLAADLGRDAAAVDVVDQNEQATVLGVRPGIDSPTSRRALAAWTVATASATGAMWVENDQRIDASTGSVGPLAADHDTSYPGIRVAVATR